MKSRSLEPVVGGDCGGRSISMLTIWCFWSAFDCKKLFTISCQEMTVRQQSAADLIDHMPLFRFFVPLPVPSHCVPLGCPCALSLCSSAPPRASPLPSLCSFLCSSSCACLCPSLCLLEPLLHGGFVIDTFCGTGATSSAPSTSRDMKWICLGALTSSKIFSRVTAQLGGLPTSQ